MASMPVLFFLLSFMLFVNDATAERNHSNRTRIIRLGSSLSPIAKGDLDLSSWVSSSGLFAFGFYPQGDGFAVGIWLVGNGEPDNNTVVWTATRDLPPVSFNSTLNFTSTGLVLKGEEDREVVPFDDNQTVDSASMLDSGNFVLYDEDSKVIFQSFDIPTDTILGGQNLTNGYRLLSSMSKSDHSSGRFSLNMQADGNLVAYPANSSNASEDAYFGRWAAEHSDSVQLSLNFEGSLCLVDNNHVDQCLTNSTDYLREKSLTNTTSIIYRATLDVDGNLRLYAHQFDFDGNTDNTSSSVQSLWSALADECEIKGYCGFNSYCSNITGNPGCECYPGFFPSLNSSTKMFLDCKQNISKADCESSDDRVMLYGVTYSEDVGWSGDYPYLVLPVKMETCKRNCQGDCDCGAALYSSGSCAKYKLPLRYGRSMPKASGVAIFKVPSGNVISPNHTGLFPNSMKPGVIVDDKSRLIMILAFTLGSISLFCLVIAVTIFLTYRRQVVKYAMISATENLGFTEECSLRSFSFDELETSTGGFTEEIGRGSFGAVYRGTVSSSNRRIAVKRLERIVDEGEREFRAEITAIARTHHRNLVQLIGFCIDGSKKLLVYEYMSNGSLADLLFKAKRHLSWKERVKIALDVARGVLYLHEECEVRIIHCNIKPQNILMDETWTAKIADFGLARLLKPEKHSRSNIGDEGISGYLAPEWQKKEPSALSVKADIYSYGVILLEIVCRRCNIEVNVSSAEEILLSSWAHQCFVAGQLDKLIAVDNEVVEGVDWKILERMVKVGLWCVQDDPSLRPSMKKVILMLEGFKDIPIPPSPAYLLE